MDNFEAETPSGSGLCSYPSCPCNEVSIPRGKGYLYITKECVDFRKDALSEEQATEKLRKIGERADSILIPGAGMVSAILVCERGAELLELDMDIAAEDARQWWKTKKVPLRPSPKKKRPPAVVAGSQVFTGHTERVNGVDISRDGRLILSCGWDETVRLWDAKAGIQLHCFQGHRGFVKAVAFSPDGRCAVSAGADRVIRVWDLEQKRQIHAMQGHSFSVFTLAFSPDSQLILSGSGDETIRLWDVKSGRQIRTFGGFLSHKDNQSIEYVAFSPDGQRALAGGSVDLKLWDIGTGKVIYRLGGQKWISGLAFFPDGQRAISSSRDKTVRIWDLSTGREIDQIKHEIEDPYNSKWSIPTISTFALSYDGHRLLSTNSSGVLYLYSLEKNSRFVQNFEGHDFNKRINSIAFSGDGCLAVSGSDDYSVRSWEIPKNL